MKLWHVILVTMLCGSPLTAETVRVRSGEHADFSRLVFLFAKPTGWHLDRLGDGYALRLDRKNIRFDLSQVYRFIPHDRFGDIIIDPDNVGVKLVMTCKCHAEAFEITPGKIVIDIKNGPDKRVVDQTDTGSAHDPQPAPPVSDKVSWPLVTIIGSFAGKSHDSIGTAIAVGVNSAPKEVAPADIAHNTEFQRLLLKELSRAAGQGLVQPAVTLPDLHVPKPEQTPPVLTAPKLAREPALPSGSPGVNITTSVDRARNSAIPPIVTNQGNPCMSPGHFDFTNRDIKISADNRIANARTGLIGEFDKVDPDALRNLVTTYLFLGFGAEARAAMTAFQSPLDNVALYLDLANIMDGKDLGKDSMLDNQLGCDSPVALWSALAHPKIPRGADVNRAAVLRTFSALPIHLRRHLGPDLAGRFLAIGDRETAALINNAITRSAGDHGSGAALIEARLKLANGDRPAAEAALERIVAQDDPVSVDALLVLMESRIDNGQAPAPNDVASADALAFEYANLKLGARLARVSILGSAYNGEFDTAFQKLGRDKNAPKAALRSELVSILAKTGSDSAFLHHGFLLLSTLPETSISQTAAWAMARRMDALGFSMQAGVFLPPRGSPESEERSLLRARILLANGDPAGALRFLAGLKGPQAEHLRGDANVRLGNTQAAIAQYQNADDTDRLAGLAWQSGDWQDVAKFGTPAQQEFARERLQTSASDQPVALKIMPSLTGARALLVQSAANRDIVQNLLKDVVPATRP